MVKILKNATNFEDIVDCKRKLKGKICFFLSALISFFLTCHLCFSVTHCFSVERDKREEDLSRQLEEARYDNSTNNRYSYHSYSYLLRKSLL